MPHSGAQAVDPLYDICRLKIWWIQVNCLSLHALNYYNWYSV